MVFKIDILDMHLFFTIFKGFNPTESGHLRCKEETAKVAIVDPTQGTGCTRSGPGFVSGSRRGGIRGGGVPSSGRSGVPGSGTTIAVACLW